MAVIISNGNTTLNTASGFYRVEASNLGYINTTLVPLSTPRYINTTFANAGNCIGSVFIVTSTSMTSRSLLVGLEEYQTVTSFNTTTERINKVAHGLNDGDLVSFTTTGALPTGITAGTRYYVVNKNADDFQISNSSGGSAIGLSGTPSGTASVGVTRAEKTLTVSDIAGQGMSGTYKYRGDYIFPAIFTTPYAVDTTASKWRIRIVHSGGSGTWNIRTSDGTNPFYAAWCDNAVTFTDNDIVVMKDYVTIDKSATFGAVLGTGESTTGVSAIVCSNVTNPAVDDVAYMKWENPPATPYTLTVGGKILMASFSGVRIGTSTNRIPIAQKATITFTAPAAGTITAGFDQISSDTDYVYGGMSSFFAYGEIPTYQYTTLKTDANTGQADLVCNDNVDWVAGDTLVIGKQNAQGAGDLTIYTIASVSGDTITLTGNVATNIRRAGASVIKLNSHGILIQNTGTYSTHRLFTPASFIMSGVDAYNTVWNLNAIATYPTWTGLLSANRSNISFTDVTHWTNSNTSSYLTTLSVLPTGALMQRCYGFRQTGGTSWSAYTGAVYKSGRMEVKDSRFLSIYSGTFTSASNIILTIENCSFENYRATSTPFFYITGKNGIYKNNKIWGSGVLYSNGGAVQIYACFNPVEISGNYYDNNAAAICITGQVTLKCIDSNSVFGSEYANTIDIGISSPGGIPDYIWKSPTGSLVLEETLQTDLTLGGRYGFESFNDTIGDDKMVYTYGKTQREMTIVHTAGGSSFRFEPVSPTDRFEYTFDVPTGNIQNKTMMIGLWCYINNANYWAGTKEMPRLTVTYDLTSTVYAEASQIAGSWQYLFVPITPTTTTGKVTVMLSGLTDATGTDRYFYWDDISVLYPAGYKLDLGGLDIWDSALPVNPPIATVMSAQDVWAVATSTLTGTGTVGKQVGDIKKDTGLIGALL